MKIKLLKKVFLFALFVSCKVTKTIDKSQLIIGKGDAIKLNINSPLLSDSIFILVKTKLENKKVVILDDDSFNQRKKKHFQEAFDFAKVKNSIPDGKEIASALRTVDSHIIVMNLYFDLSLTKDNDIIVNKLSYTQGKYPFATNLKQIPIEIDQYKTSKLDVLIDSTIISLIKK